MNFEILENLPPNAKIAGVIGDPIAQSLSPFLHNYWLTKYQIAGVYIPLKVSKLEFSEFVKNLPDLGFSGCNVTIPHKEEAAKLCNFISKAAKKIGAVNTITIADDGKIYGDNSDYFGFIQNIKSSQPSFDFRNKKVLLLGAGGAARGIIYGLLNEGVKEIIIANRSLEKAQNLADHFENCVAINWNEKDNKLAEIDLLVNSTSLGMSGSTALEINLKNLNKSAVVSDIVYKPLMTNLLSQAQSHGNPIVTGIGMLIYQGMVGFEKWFGKKPEVTQELMNQMLSQ